MSLQAVFCEFSYGKNDAISSVMAVKKQIHFMGLVEEKESGSDKLPCTFLEPLLSPQDCMFRNHNYFIEDKDFLGFEENDTERDWDYKLNIKLKAKQKQIKDEKQNT